jgi:hypothetical protein
MLVRFLFAAFLLAGCAAPVTMPSLSHSADYESGHQARIEAARTRPSGQRELPHDECVSRTPDYAGGVYIPRDSIWTGNHLEPGTKTACMVAVVIFVVVAIATVTVWR